MNKKLFFIVSIIAVLILTACGNQQVETVPSEDESATASLSVYTTVYPLQYFAERIGGEHVHVQSIYPPGADEHSFDPTQKDMIALADSDLFFYVGLGLEGFVDKAELTLKGEHVKMIATAEGIAEEMLHEGHDHMMKPMPNKTSIITDNSIHMFGFHQCLVLNLQLPSKMP